MKNFKYVILTLVFVLLSFTALNLNDVKATILVDEENEYVEITGTETLNTASYNGVDISGMNIFVGNDEESGNLTINGGTFGKENVMGTDFETGEDVIGYSGRIFLTKGTLTINGGTFLISVVPENGTLTINNRTFKSSLTCKF